LLERLYARRGLTPPRITQIKDDQVPLPYKALLVHSLDMTPTLEGFYRQPVGLTVLSREVRDEAYLREVVLTLEAGAHPVLFGVIRICLGRFSAETRARVLAEQQPLGSLLRSEGIPHISWPQAFFRAEPDAHISAALRLRRHPELFGRRNVLLDGARRLLAEVIEVLAPVEGPNDTRLASS
jgi:chorismate-pyruvate lyase